MPHKPRKLESTLLELVGAIWIQDDTVKYVSHWQVVDKICPKFKAYIIFFLRPGAGLTNRVHVWHSDSRVPLTSRLICILNIYYMVLEDSEDSSE